MDDFIVFSFVLELELELLGVFMVFGVCLIDAVLEVLDSTV